MPPLILPLFLTAEGWIQFVASVGITARGSSLQLGREGNTFFFCPAPVFQHAAGDRLWCICGWGAPPAAGITPSGALLGQAGATRDIRN